MGAPWCMAYVWQMGRQALGADWPVPRTASVQDGLVAWAKTVAGVFLPSGGPFERGDLFLVWNAGLQRYAHVGFVEHVVGSMQSTLDTLEGNTSAGGSREGFGVFQRRRGAHALAGVRWTAALGTPASI
ncbi:MAG: CHAP domain-containing protein [bacterium]